jgi:hypothetical protein
MASTATRSAAAVKASETRRRNKALEQAREQAKGKALTKIYEGLTEAEQEFINETLSGAWTCLDDYYEEHLNQFFNDHEEEMKDAIRTLLRQGTKATTIIASMRNGDATTEFQFGVYGMMLDGEEILQNVLLEDEFLGSKQETPEAKEKMWELTDTIVKIPDFIFDENNNVVEAQ